MTKQKWSTVLLQPSRAPRFRSNCYSCGAAGSRGKRGMRVCNVGYWPAVAAYIVVPRRIDVPICGVCQSKQWWRFGLFTGAAVGIALLLFCCRGRLGAGVAQLCILLMVVGGSMGWLFPPRVDIAFDGSRLRYSFRQREAAAWFAADNEAVIEGPSPEEQDDGVGAGGDHGDTGVHHHGGDDGGSD